MNDSTATPSYVGRQRGIKNKNIKHPNGREIETSPPAFLEDLPASGGITIYIRFSAKTLSVF